METLPRKGYRLIGEMKPTEAEQSSDGVVGAEIGASGPIASDTLPNMPAKPRGGDMAVQPSRSANWRKGAVWAAGGLVATGALLRLGWSLRSRAGPAQPIRSLAVLPLNNLSGDVSRDYFAAGVTEQLTTELGRMEDVRVISRTSADHYKGTTKTLPQIARELGADAVIEGAIAQSADRVRITVQLIRASTDQHLWARAYAGKLEDILQMQDDVARSVADKVRSQLSMRELAGSRGDRRVDPEAYELYLQGVALQRGSSGLDLKALEMFQRSIVADPGYAPAYAWESEAYNSLGGFFANLPLNEARAKAKAAATRALELDPQLSDAHVAMADVKENEWDWRGVEDEFRLAIAANPSNAIANNNFAGFSWRWDAQVNR